MTLSSVVRVAIGVYIQHLDQLLEQIHQARAEGIQPDFTGRDDASHSLLMERFLLREANAGGEAEIDPETLATEDGELPLYRDLAKAHRDQAAAARRAGLRIELDKTLETFNPLHVQARAKGK